MKRPRLNDVYNPQNAPREVSGQNRYVADLKNYKAEYRMNTGYWVMEQLFRASSDAEAKVLAEAALPPRKPKDLTYMVVWKLWCLDDPEETTSNPTENP